MSVNRFSWNRYDDDSVVAFATDLGFRGSPDQARTFLAKRVPRPSDDFVQAAWRSLARVWLRRHNLVAMMVVQELLDSGVDAADGRLGPVEDWQRILDSLRLMPALRTRLLSWLVMFGEDADIWTAVGRTTSRRQDRRHHGRSLCQPLSEARKQELLLTLRRRCGRKAPAVCDFERAIARNDDALMARVLGRFPDLRDHAPSQVPCCVPIRISLPPDWGARVLVGAAMPPSDDGRSHNPHATPEPAHPRTGLRLRQMCGCGNFAMSSGDKCHDCARSE